MIIKQRERLLLLLLDEASYSVNISLAYVELADAIK